MAKICVDRILTEEQVLEAAKAAIAENPDNSTGDGDGIGTLELAMSTEKKWKTGKELSVSFLGGERGVHDRVVEVANQWCEFANLAFDFGDYQDAKIRIAFEEGSSWSWIGTDALVVKKGVPTMNFGWLAPDSPDADFNRVVLHEFGHALGCIHEHQSPAGGVPWNLDVVYDYYISNFGWTEIQVFENLIEKYNTDSTQYGEFDPNSIMIYHIPKELTLNGYEVPWNTELSEMDKKMMGEVYA